MRFLRSLATAFALALAAPALAQTPSSVTSAINTYPWVNGQRALTGANVQSALLDIVGLVNNMGTWSPTGIYTPIGTPISLYTYMPPSVAVQAAAGTFTGDPTPYIQAALNACSGQSYAHAQLLIPPGTYPVGDIVNPPGNNYCDITATGAYFQKQLNDNAAVFTIYGNYVSLTGGFFDANGKGSSISPAVGIVGANDRLAHVKAANSQTHAFYFLNAVSPVAEDLEAYGSIGGAGVDMSGVSFGQFRHLKTYNNAKEGVAVDNITYYTFVDGVETYNNGLTGAFGGVGSGASSDYNTLTNILSHDNNAWGIGLQGIHSKITNFTTYSNKYGGVYFEGFDPTNHPDANHLGDLGYDLLANGTSTEGLSQTFTGSLSPGSTGQLTVTAGVVIPGQWLSGANVPGGLEITSQVSGTTNGSGVYNLSSLVGQALPSQTMTAGTGPAVQIDGGGAQYTIGSTTYTSPPVPGIVISNVDHPFGIINDLGGITTILDTTKHVVYNPGQGGGFNSNFVARGFNAGYAWLTGGQGPDANLWDSIFAGSSLRFRAVNDANTAANPWLDVLKNGFAPYLARFYEELAAPQASIFGVGYPTDTNTWDNLPVGPTTAASVLRFRAVNDANTLANAWLDVFRSGYQPTLAQFYIPLATPLATPASSSAPCAAGQFQDDANYHYVCVATNTWKRVALSTF